MNSVGIIAEYNPFHNGHLYQINKVKELFPGYTIIVVMSGNYTERGDISLMDKYTKTKICLDNGIDLVVELPFQYATSSSDYFAKGAIEILNELNVNYLVFGSESNDLDKLNEIVELDNNKEFNDKIKTYLKEGLSYRDSYNKALNDYNYNLDNNPNDILGICYLKELKKTKSNIIPYPIKRTNDYNDTELNDSITSALSIRSNLDKDISKYIPYNQNLINNRTINDFYNELKYHVLLKDLSLYEGVDNYIENNLSKYIFDYSNIDDLINKIKSKNYSYLHIKRCILHIITGYTKKINEVLLNKNHVRVLGFNKKGQEYLNSIKDETNIITKFDKDNIILQNELKVSNIYYDKYNKELINSEYKKEPIK